MTIREIISNFINIQLDPAVFLSFLILILSIIFLILDKTNIKFEFNLKKITFIFLFSLILILCFIFIFNKKITMYQIKKTNEKKNFDIKNTIKLDKLKENFFFYYVNYFNNTNNNTKINNNQLTNLKLYTKKTKSFLYQILNILYYCFIKTSNYITLMINETSNYLENKYNKYYLNK